MHTATAKPALDAWIWECGYNLARIFAVIDQTPYSDVDTSRLLIVKQLATVAVAGHQKMLPATEACDKLLCQDGSKWFGFNQVVCHTVSGKSFPFVQSIVLD